ncbi:uncharacterized protein LOC133179328 [Saccostrea echinata]|uniref:uncharacterized protein LOC133179328 n=1 Tax=Saccostrea echinata TaxID=191078 RepID=UPI002A83D0A6|nr:uncharacterized protein LOC133179328 [Saccostrea echinata]
MPVSFSDPYYTEYTCKNSCTNFCISVGCYNCCQKYYSHIVMVFAVAMSVFGFADLIVGGQLATSCPYNGAIYSTLMLAQGVISMIEGVMIFYTIGRAHEYPLFRSGLPTFQYAFVTYSLTAILYIFSLTLSGLQLKVTEGTVESSCADYHGYITWRLVFNILVPVSPIALVLTILAILFVLICLAGGSKTEDN